jgi:hypothetical protein
MWRHLAKMSCPIDRSPSLYGALNTYISRINLIVYEYNNRLLYCSKTGHVNHRYVAPPTGINMTNRGVAVDPFSVPYKLLV